DTLLMILIRQRWMKMYLWLSLTKGQSDLYRGGAPDNFIHNVYVDPSFLQQGIGKALLDRCLVEIGRPATLKCLQKNTNALSFYQTQGWTIKDEGPSDDGPYYLMEYNS